VIRIDAPDGGGSSADVVAAERAVFGFRSMWGGAPTHLVRAPGRVNLIGEHIDYCGLPVLPFALDASVWVATSPASAGRVRIATSLPGLDPCEFVSSDDIARGDPGDWGNYARAAVQALAEPRSLGFDAFVASDVPVAAGLSSSSALVVGTALSWLTANGRPLTPIGSTGADQERLDLAARLAVGERYVGTAGGGMDQATSLLGRRGHALHMRFDPLRTDWIALPEDWRFVIAHSGEPAEKSGVAQQTYNRRTQEAAAAASSIWAALGVNTPRSGALRSYPMLLGRLEPAELWQLADQVLDGTVAMRFRHVVTETRRVSAAVSSIAKGDVSGFGGLMLESHASLRDDYVVSTTRLNALVDAALHAGATGARLTGAGLGGCIVALCMAGIVEGVLEALREVSAAGMAFVARPSDGASVQRL
jgi:galactokinase